MAFARSEDLKTPLCRLSYARDLFKARSQEEGKPPKFGCTLIFPNSARAELEKIVAKVISDQWGAPGLERARKKLIRSPFLVDTGPGTKSPARSKKTDDLHPGMEGDVFFLRVQANEDRPPRVWYRDPNKQETVDVVYSGVYGKAILNAFAWNASSGDGVSFGLSGFQKLQDGDRLGGSGGIDPCKWSETIEDTGPVPNVGGGGAASLFGD